MPSVSETAAMVRGVNTEVEEALTKLNEATEAIDRAKRALFEAMGDGQPASLLDYMGALQNAVATAERSGAFLLGGKERGEEYIARLYS